MLKFLNQCEIFGRLKNTLRVGELPCQKFAEKTSISDFVSQDHINYYYRKDWLNNTNITG
jgi:hypothetical protein